MFAGFVECWVIVISVVGWWTGFWWHDCKSGDDQLNINCISGVYAAATGLLYCFLSPHDMKRLVVYCYFCMFVYLSVNLSIKSTKFGGGYLVNRLPELDKILHIDRPGLAVHQFQDWWILAQGVPLELYGAAGEACLEFTYLGRHKGQFVSNLCPPSVGIWIGSVDYHKGSCSATGCLW